MGAVLGIAAFGRTQEKLGGANNGGLQPVGQSVTTTFGTPQSGGFGNSSGFSSPAPTSGGFGSFSTTMPAASWGTTPPATGQVVAGFGGKPAPMQPQQPEL
jgi:hypothetical protein